MKSIFNKLSILAVASALLWSCKKDETQVVLTGSGAPILSKVAAKDTLVLLEDSASKAALTFNWTAQTYESPVASVTYSLQMVKKGGDFKNPDVEINMGKLLTKAYTVSALNAEVVKILAPNSLGEISVRIVAAIPNSAAISYSNTLNLIVKGYRSIIKYSFPNALNIAGNYQGWNPGAADCPQVVSVSNNGIYDGYINFNDPSPQFKMVKGNNWGAGDYGDAGGGALSNGGNNLQLSAGAGIYRLTANTGAMSWSATKITRWGIIGSATAGGWGADQAMTLDPATGNYSLTLDLTAGEIKFRANNDWGINFGDNKSNGGPDNKPDYGGDNIAIAAAGNYTVRLEIGLAGNYYYSVKKNY
jgi:hypothetical protein